MALQNSPQPDFPSHDHPCHICSRNIPLDRSLVAKLEECTCAEEGVPGSPGSASTTDYCAEVGAPSTPAGESVTGFSPFIVQSNEWGQQSVHTSPYSLCRADKVNRSYSFNTGSRPMAYNPRTPENQSHSPAPSHEKSEIPPNEMASFDSVTTYGPVQDYDYMTEDSGDDTSVYSESNSASEETMYENSELHVKEVSAAILEKAKRTLINQLMQEVWVRFDKDWTAKFTACAGSETTLIPPSRQTASTSAQGIVPKRQRKEDDDDNSSSDDHGRAPKRSIPQQTPPDGEGLALSCPFRKHDPRKYRFPEYRTCALSFWKNVGRVKEHIYRCHRVPIHCTRCWMVFDSKDLLKSHSRDEANRCQVHPEQVLDGITPEAERLLRSRKKEYRGQSEPELWRKMYRTLFPDEIVPSPYYEAIRDENADPLYVRERANYHEYVRRELPRLVRSRLESAVGLQFETLASALDEIIQGCMDELLMDYETVRATTNADSNRDATAVRSSIASRTSMPSEVLRTHKQNNSSIGSVPELQSAFEYFTTLNQSPGPSTPGDPALSYGHYQANDMDLAYRNQDAPLDCLCPRNACTCPDRQRQAQSLPAAAFEFNTPEKTLERVTLAEEWNPDGLLMAASFGEDDLNVNWDH